MFDVVREGDEDKYRGCVVGTSMGVVGTFAKEQEKGQRVVPVGEDDVEDTSSSAQVTEEERLWPRVRGRR